MHLRTGLFKGHVLYPSSLWPSCPWHCPGLIKCLHWARAKPWEFSYHSLKITFTTCLKWQDQEIREKNPFLINKCCVIYSSKRRRLLCRKTGDYGVLERPLEGSLLSFTLANSGPWSWSQAPRKGCFQPGAWQTKHYSTWRGQQTIWPSRPLMTLNDSDYHHTCSPQNTLLWLQGTQRTLNSAFRTDGSHQHKPGDTAGVRASRNLQAPSTWHNLDALKGNTHGFVLSDIRRAKVICHFLYSKSTGIGRRKKYGPGEAGQAGGWRPEAAWPPRPPDPAQPVSPLLWPIQLNSHSFFHSHAMPWLSH